MPASTNSKASRDLGDCSPSRENAVNRLRREADAAEVRTQLRCRSGRAARGGSFLGRCSASTVSECRKRALYCVSVAGVAACPVLLVGVEFCEEGESCPDCLFPAFEFDGLGELSHAVGLEVFE